VQKIASPVRLRSGAADSGKKLLKTHSKAMLKKRGKKLPKMYSKAMLQNLDITAPINK